MIKGMRVLAAWCLWQALLGALIAPSGATAAAAVQAPENRGPRRLLGTAQTIAALDARPEARDAVAPFDVAPTARRVIAIYDEVLGRGPVADAAL